MVKYRLATRQKQYLIDIIDELYFFQDILDTGLESICNSLTDALCSHFIIPILCSSMHRTRLNSGAIVDFMGSNDLEVHQDHMTLVLS